MKVILLLILWTWGKYLSEENFLLRPMNILEKYVLKESIIKDTWRLKEVKNFCFIHIYKAVRAEWLKKIIQELFIWWNAQSRISLTNYFTEKGNFVFNTSITWLDNNRTPFLTNKFLIILNARIFMWMILTSNQREKIRILFTIKERDTIADM